MVDLGEADGFRGFWVAMFTGQGGVPVVFFFGNSTSTALIIALAG